jgi:type IV pilus assembly protein PilX
MMTPQAQALMKVPVRISGRNTFRYQSKRQKGAVLVIGLIILVVLTLLGIQGMRTNVAQERMASNMRERNVAFQAAESALRVGEATGPFNGLGVPLADPLNWAAGEETGSLAAFDDGLEADPVFHVGPPERVRIGLTLPPEFRLIYPIAARGVGRQEGSVVVLQSGFEPPN